MIDPCTTITERLYSHLQQLEEAEDRYGRFNAAEQTRQDSGVKPLNSGFTLPNNLVSNLFSSLHRKPASLLLESSTA